MFSRLLVSISSCCKQKQTVYWDILSYNASKLVCQRCCKQYKMGIWSWFWCSIWSYVDYSGFSMISPCGTSFNFTSSNTICYIYYPLLFCSIWPFSLVSSSSIISISSLMYSIYWTIYLFSAIISNALSLTICSSTVSDRCGFYTRMTLDFSRFEIISSLCVLSCWYLLCTYCVVWRDVNCYDLSFLFRFG